MRRVTIGSQNAYQTLIPLSCPSPPPSFGQQCCWHSRQNSATYRAAIQVPMSSLEVLSVHAHELSKICGDAQHPSWCVCMCTCVCVCIHIYMCRSTHMCAYIHICMCTCIYVYVCMYVYIYVSVYIMMMIYVNIYKYIHICKYMYVYICIYIDIFI